MKKALPWIFFGFALTAILVLFVLLLNGGSALDDARSEVKRLRLRSDLALMVVRKDWIGRDKASVVALSKTLERQSMIVGVEGDSFKIGDFIFKTRGGLVTEVHYMD